jgi:Domain of unknown function (DUF4118)
VSRSSPLWPSVPGTMLYSIIAFLAVATAVIAGMLVDRFLQSAPFVSLFLCAVLVAAWLGGVGPGLLATALSILAFQYFFISPIHSLVTGFQDLLRIALFALTGGFRGVRLRGAKAHGGIAAARARRSAGKRSRAANRERRTDPGGTSCAASGARASVDDRHDPGNRGALSSRRLARFCQPDLADLYRSFTGQFVGTPLGSCYSSR